MEVLHFIQKPKEGKIEITLPLELADQELHITVESIKLPDSEPEKSRLIDIRKLWGIGKDIHLSEEDFYKQ